MVNADQIDETTREASTALVPLTPVLQLVRKVPLTRPDPSFVTQLIANAEHLPQASRLRRGSSEDARMAYGGQGPASERHLTHASGGLISAATSLYLAPLAGRGRNSSAA